MRIYCHEGPKHGEVMEVGGNPGPFFLVSVREAPAPHKILSPGEIPSVNYRTAIYRYTGQALCPLGGEAEAYIYKMDGWQS
jgi:hypothetical protein